MHFWEGSTVMRVTRFLAAALIAAMAALGGATASATVGYHEAHTQSVDPGRALNGVSCIPGTTSCVVTDSAGEALFTEAASATAAATWDPFGPLPVSPARAVACPSSSLCLVAAGEDEGGASGIYWTGSLGGSFLLSHGNGNPLFDVSCPSEFFCLSAAENGFVAYSTDPSNAPSWTAVQTGTGPLTGVKMTAASCLSSSFCAVVDSIGNVRVATTELHIEEASGWTATDIDGTTALRDVACASTSSCVGVDGSGEIIDLAIASGGEATAMAQALPGAAQLVAVTCNGSTCAAVDHDGAAFASTDGGAHWVQRYGGGGALTGVSCASASLCAATSATGDVTTFNPATAVAPLIITTGSLPAGTAGDPYATEVVAAGGEPPYRWSATGLPPGLSIDAASGRISGTPSTAVCVRSPCPQPAGEYAPVVTVTDAAGVQASQPLTLQLAAKVIPPQTPPPPPPVAKCVIPKLVGKTLHRAKALLREADCAVGKVTRLRGRRTAGHRRLGPPLVAFPSAVPGTVLPAGTKLHVTLARRPPRHRS